MSKEYGLAALNLEMTDRVPRTEYSAAEHWELVKAVTGIEIDPVNATQDQKLDASRAFMEKWNYDMLWTVKIKADQLGPWHTSMGHAVYAAAGTDFPGERTGFRKRRTPDGSGPYDFTPARNLWQG